jgi:hypothetical protein
MIGKENGLVNGPVIVTFTFCAVIVSNQPVGTATMMMMTGSE